MSDTSRFQMPLLDAAQAQKHVTINEALVRADTLASHRVESRSFSAPPGSPTDGAAFIVGSGASGDWVGQEGQLALYLNGGWAFIEPWAGWTVWIVDEGVEATFGADWVSARIGGSLNGSAIQAMVAEEDHVLALAGSSTTTAIIPDKAVVLGVTGRVIEEITGATGWSLGVAGSTDRYGSGYGATLNAFAQGVTGQPLAYYGGTELVVTAEGGNFTAGRVRLAVHYFDIAPPAPV